jgi:transcriptional regulator with XRE-family HTH domain
LKLAAWRKREGQTQDWLAAELGCSQPYISQIERVDGPIVPGPAIMIEIFRLTGGFVTPNDFYNLPSLNVRAAA